MFFVGVSNLWYSNNGLYRNGQKTMRDRFLLKKPSGFTLLEALIAVIVLGILTYMSLPRLYSVTRKISNQEARTILLALYGEQMKYAKENNAFCGSLTQLDVEIPTPEKFDPVPVGSALHGTVSCGGNTTPYLASMTSIDNNYTLYVLTDGSIACTPCPSDICSNMGFGDLTGAVAPCAADADCAPGTCVTPPGVCVY
jgi:prepilin-type N-terminal cleavage/methylation domain-containing protein